jgi:hypothetical protein
MMLRVMWFSAFVGARAVIASPPSKGFGAQEGAKAMLSETTAVSGHMHKASTVVLDPTTLPHCKDYADGVVMGMAANYQWGQMSNFVISLRNTGYKGKIVLGVRGVAGLDVSKGESSVTKTNLEKHCVTAIEAVADTTYLPKMPVASRRFVLYEQWITILLAKKVVTAAEWILLIDVRDSIFQRTPFAGAESSGASLLFFADSHPAIRDKQDIDSHTYLGESCFRESQAALKEMILKPETSDFVICSGTVMGTIAQTGVYLQAMIQTFETFDCWPVGGIDQGYHNYVYFMNNSLIGAKVYPPGEGPVMTLGSSRDFSRSGRNKVCIHHTTLLTSTPPYSHVHHSTHIHTTTHHPLLSLSFTFLPMPQPFCTAGVDSLSCTYYTVLTIHSLYCRCGLTIHTRRRCCGVIRKDFSSTKTALWALSYTSGTGSLHSSMGGSRKVRGEHA